jgi:hypothetical protein
MGRVEPAGNPDHELLESRRTEPRLQTLHLDVVDLLATFAAACRIGWHVWETINRAS